MWNLKKMEISVYTSIPKSIWKLIRAHNYTSLPLQQAPHLQYSLAKTSITIRECCLLPITFGCSMI